MMRVSARALACGIVMLAWLHGSRLEAQTFVGTWIRQDTPMTMTVEVCCGSGRRLTYRIPSNGTESLLVLETALDGKDAPVMMRGQPTGQTMAIRQLDDRHAVAVLKVNGQDTGTARGTLSADGRTLTVDYTAPPGGQANPKEIWLRK